VRHSSLENEVSPPPPAVSLRPPGTAGSRLAASRSYVATATAIVDIVEIAAIGIYGYRDILDVLDVLDIVQVSILDIL
jgi:hypothetical protein